jgi:hypothetical protein
MLGEWFLMLQRSMWLHLEELVWMCNLEAFGTIYTLSHSRRTKSARELARSVNVHVVHVGPLLKQQVRYTYSGSLLL